MKEDLNDKRAFPGRDGLRNLGLTKREYAAIHICAGLLGNDGLAEGWLAHPAPINEKFAAIAEIARTQTDALFAELAKVQP